MANKSVVEVLRLVKEAKTTNDKLNIIRRFSSFALISVLQFGYDNRLVTPYLPEGDIPEELLSSDRHQSLDHAIRSVPGFTQKASPTEKELHVRARHEKGWVNLTSAMRDPDRRWLVMAKDKTLPVALGLSHRDLNSVISEVPAVPTALPEKLKALQVPAAETSNVLAEVSPTVTSFLEQPEAAPATKLRRKPGPKPGSKNKPKAAPVV